MNLCIDIGNTRAKVAVFDNDKEIYFSRNEVLILEEIANIKNQYQIENCILSTTRILSDDVIEFLEENFELIILDEDTKLPINNLYGSPKTLGKDRLAAAVGAAFLYPNSPSIIIDAGTCLTYNFIDNESNYLGGNIAPGLSMRLMAMHKFTDKLPLVDLRYNNDLFGKNTETALQNGALKGAIYEVSAFISQVFDKYGKCNIILTGGDALLFVEHLNFKIFAHQNLVLLGLNQILTYNRTS